MNFTMTMFFSRLVAVVRFLEMARLSAFILLHFLYYFYCESVIDRMKFCGRKKPKIRFCPEITIRKSII